MIVSMFVFKLQYGLTNDLAFFVNSKFFDAAYLKMKEKLESEDRYH